MFYDFCTFQTLDKQKTKTEEEQKNLGIMKKDNQALMISCEELEKKRQKSEHDLQTKDTRIACLEGQLAQVKKQLDMENNKVQILTKIHGKLCCNVFQSIRYAERILVVFTISQL